LGQDAPPPTASTFEDLVDDRSRQEDDDEAGHEAGQQRVTGPEPLGRDIGDDADDERQDSYPRRDARLPQVRVD
jgi:hypothetical protein